MQNPQSPIRETFIEVKSHPMYHSIFLKMLVCYLKKLLLWLHQSFVPGKEQLQAQEDSGDNQVTTQPDPAPVSTLIDNTSH